MFARLIGSLKADNNNDKETVRRRYTRRDCDRCVSVVGDKIYPVENWSLGGVLINADERDFGVNDEINMTMKFKLRDNVVDVPHAARVIRKSSNKIAFEFKPLTQQIRGNFQNVVDDYVASQFAASQSQL